jgi:hypothetical protein
VDLVPDPLLLKKSGSDRNRNRDFWICSQKPRSLDHRGGQYELRGGDIYVMLLLGTPKEIYSLEDQGVGGLIV